jgi:putative transposase
MPRRARIVIPHQAHHIIQRGNYQQYVFEKDADFRTYLYLMKEYSEKYQLKIHAFCLMGNHVHFIVTPVEESGLSETFRNVHARFSQYKNIEKRRLGHLWQGRFYSCVLSETHLFRAIRYVEMNPVRARMVKYAWDYPWSSTRQHLGLERSPIIRTMFHESYVELGVNIQNWKTYLTEDDPEMIKEMRKKTQKGLAIGRTDFIIKMEEKFNVILQELKAGRPKLNK